MPWLLVATLICDTLMAHNIFLLHGPMGTVPDCHAYWFFSHPVETSQLLPQSVGGGETSLLSRTNVCSQHCSWNNPHAALSLFPFVPSEAEKMKARTSEDLRKFWRIKNKTAGLKPAQSFLCTLHSPLKLWLLRKRKLNLALRFKRGRWIRI